MLVLRVVVYKEMNAALGTNLMQGTWFTFNQGIYQYYYHNNDNYYNDYYHNQYYILGLINNKIS